MKYGLIGEHLSHSFSVEIHKALGNDDYELLELSPETVADFFAKRDFCGVNVTIPYKETVLPLLDEITKEAAAIGAVNTVVNRGGRLVGCNTDFAGLSALFDHAGVDPAGRKVLILGTGGTARTALFVCRARGAAAVLRVSRRPGPDVVTYEAAYRDHTDAEIVVNATPVGMYPHAENCPLDVSRFPRLLGVIDAVYNPLRTRLVLSARARGIAAEGGLYMLTAQGVAAAALFRGGDFPAGTAETLYSRLLAGKENVVLTGMPGAGKTTIGRRLAAALKRPFIDTDEEIVKAAGCDIPTLFKAEGEAGFRARESAIIRHLAPMCGAVIATGGGAVLREENVTALKQNGHVFFLDRAPENLTPTGDRPLSSDRASLLARYRERIDLYRATADTVVNGNGTPEQVAEQIQKELYRL